MCVCMYVCLSVCLSVCPSVCLSAAARLVKFDSEGIVKLKLEVSLASVSLELSNSKYSIFKGASTGMCGYVHVCVHIYGCGCVQVCVCGGVCVYK